MQKVLGDYKNRKKILNYSKQNPLQSFYKRNFICWLIITINFEQRDVIVLSVRQFYITTKIIKKFSKLWLFLFSLFNDVTSYSLHVIWMSKFKFHYLCDMEYDCHIFSKYLVLQIKNVVFQSKYLVPRSKTLDFDRNTRYFESEISKN